MNKYLTASVICFISFIVYFGTATHWLFRPTWSLEYINTMAVSLRQGRLDIVSPSTIYDLANYHGRWYMTWGPLSALVHMPLQLVVGGRYVPTIYTSGIFGALSVGVVWFVLLRLRDEWFPLSRLRHVLFFVVLYAFGTIQFYLSTIGSVWQVNQVVSTFFGIFGLALILKKQRSTKDYVLSSTCCSIALWGRPVIGMLLVVPFFLFLTDSKQKQKLIAFTPVILSLFLLLAYNGARFGNPFETGHRFLVEAPDLAAKRQLHGIFSLSYLPTNFWYMMINPPRLPKLGIDLNGNSIFFLNPLLLFAFFTMKFKNTLIRAMWLGIIATALPSLLYYNTGWVQFGYRYALDFSFLLILLVYFWFKGRVFWWMYIVLFYTVWINYSGIRLLQ